MRLMKKWHVLPGLFLFTIISCEQEIPSMPSNPPIGIEDPQEQFTYESKGYYLEGELDNDQIVIRDTIDTIVGSTLGALSTGQNPDSVTLSFGINFRIIDPTGKPLETFNISFQKKEAVINLDFKHNYKDLNKINEIITKGSWEFCRNKALLKDKGVSVSYIDQRDDVVRQWFTEHLYDQLFDYSDFKFQLDSVVNDAEDHLLVAEGSLDCIIHNFSNPEEQKNLKVKFRGPITYYWK
jgi:hypothetical protein